MKFKQVVFDIETTMTADKVWCIVCKHGDNYYQFKDGKNLHRFEEFAKQYAICDHHRRYTEIGS